MRAIQVSDPGRAELVELARPDPDPGERLVRVARVGICGTDRKLLARGSDPPRVPGHEVAGHLEDGTPVAVHPDVGCGRCRLCHAGFDNRCPDRTPVGLAGDGGLADYVVVPAGHVVPLDGVPVEWAPVLEPLACCGHAVALLPVAEGTPALVVGAGAMGILSMWALQAAGARVVVCQRSEPRRGQAGDLGADAVIGPAGDPGEALGSPPEVAVVTAPTSQALGWTLEAVAIGATVHAFAGIPGDGQVDANVVHYRHLHLVGSTGSRLSDYRRALELVGAGTVDLRRLPVSVVPLAGTPDALGSRPAGAVLKLLVDVGEGGGR